MLLAATRGGREWGQPRREDTMSYSRKTPRRKLWREGLELLKNVRIWLQKLLLKMKLLRKTAHISNSAKQWAQGVLEITVGMSAVLYGKYLIKLWTKELFSENISRALSIISTEPSCLPQFSPVIKLPFFFPTLFSSASASLRSRPFFSAVQLFWCPSRSSCVEERSSLGCFFCNKHSSEKHLLRPGRVPEQRPCKTQPSWSKR